MPHERSSAVSARSGTVITLLADANINGHVARLGFLMRSPYWRDVWDGLQIRVAAFGDVGLDPADTDAVVWDCCQNQGLILITSNRNEDGPDSLETTIRTRSTATSLPVFT